MRHRVLPFLFCAGALACAPSEPPRGGEDPDNDQEVQGDASVASEPTGPVVVFLGTSLTAGLGLARPEDTYVARLAELADSAGLPFEAVNAGVSGDTSAGGLRRLDWVLREPVDVLVVELGANDGLRGQDPEATAENLRAILDRTRARYPEAELILAGMEAPPNLGPDYTARFRAVFPAVVAQEGGSLVPFLLEGVAGVPALNQDDGIHPTAEGHRMMAQTVWPVLEPILRSLAVARGGSEDAR
jgi:acyl-CoA thioesterase-1